MLLADLFSPTDLIVIVAVLLLIFGGKKLPGLARSLGSASSEFKKGVDEGAKPKTAPKSAPESTQEP
ncbi:MAG: Sec-independent protein translocase subunit TatA/TatB [Ferrimicrobium sp.]